MDINSDFSACAAVHAARLDWTPSPIPGVDRRFSSHTHGGGEEFLVLDGVFEDEHSACGHLCSQSADQQPYPSSELGCTIFVKLWQFDPDDRTPVRIDTSRLSFAPAPDLPGVEFTLLYEGGGELVLMERWAPDTHVRCRFLEALNCWSWTAALPKEARLSPGSLGSGRRPAQRCKRLQGQRAANSGSNQVILRMSRACQLRLDM